VSAGQVTNQGKYDLTQECFLKFAKKIGLPQIFALSVSDRSLVYRLDQMEDLRFFLAEIKTLDSFNLKEVVLEYPKGGTVTDSSGNTFSNQFIASIINKKASYASIALNKPAIMPNREKRDMITGSEWIYYKLYGQPFNTDTVLLMLNRALETFQKSGMIYEWFFVRYLDPLPHLRLRIRLNRQEIGTIIISLELRLKNLQKKCKLTEIQTATYQRELERYPEKIISVIEASFCLSTRMIIRAIKARNLTQQLPIYLTGIVPAYWLINDWIKDPAKRLVFITNVRDNLFAEFGGSAALKIALDETKRSFKKEIAQSIKDEKFFLMFGLKREWRDWRAVMSTISLSVKKNREQLLADLLHMHFNRVFHTEMREQELVAYTLMHQYELTSQKRK